ncbi:MAG: penicillin-insensitive murein endopeptidase [Polyangiaceae bacterium]
MQVRQARLLALVAALAVLVSGLPSSAKPAVKGKRDPDKHAQAAPRAKGKSIGSPSEGHLQGGRELRASKELRTIGAYRWGLPELVGMLERAAGRVADKHEGAVLTVGDLSRKGGGDIAGHKSHESGRDADVGFYLVKNGAQFFPARFAHIDEEGRAIGLRGVRFDDARNWTLVESFLTDRETRPLQIFVARHLRKRLLEHAAKIGASSSVRARAAEVLLQPKRALPHDDHFHVRIACPKGQKDCSNFAKTRRTSAPTHGRKATPKGGARPPKTAPRKSGAAPKRQRH